MPLPDSLKQALKPKSVADTAAIGKVAKTPAEQVLVLVWALQNKWDEEEIETVDRVDTDDWHGWVMWQQK